MSRQAMKGIGQVIKANTTEKSIDELRAEGKHRVRVVSSERVMAIIQAIVDDTINSEVGEITKRDRDRIVSDTQDRFSRVLQMQQDLEQKVDNLRGSLRDTELQRDGLVADKALLESQLASARRLDGDADAVAKLSRDLNRMRDAVERAPRDAGVLDDAAVSKVVEKLAARLEREFRSVAVCLAGIREEFGRSAGDGDAVTNLRADLKAIGHRMHGIETSSSEMAERVSRAVRDEIEGRSSAAEDRRGVAAALDAAHLTESIDRLHLASDETRRSVLQELADIRSSVDDARTHALGAQSEQLREFDRRAITRASESAEVVALAVERLAHRQSAIDEALLALRRDLVEVVDRGSASMAAPVAEALVHARSEAARAATSAARAAELQTAHASRLDDAVAELHDEIAALSARGVDADERRRQTVQELSDQIARSAAVQSQALETNFKGALEQALDKITRTMERATARPIETSGEATEVLLSKIFDGPDGEVTSNLDQLEVEERRSRDGIAKSVGRLRAMNGLTATAAE